MGDHHGKLDDECCALSFSGAVGAHLSAMELDQMFDDGQSQAQTAVAPRGRCVGLSETFEKMGKKLGADSFAGIDDAYFHMAIHAAEADLHLSTLGCELDGVGKEIP